MNLDSTPISTSSKPKVSGVKLLLIMFILFVFISSDIFTENVIANFGDSAVKNRNVTSWGVVLQGIFFVIIYSVMTYLLDSNIL